MRRFTVPIEVREDAEEVLFLPEATAADWALIFGQAKAYRFFEGDVLMRAGEADRTLYFLVEGSVRVQAAGPAFKEIEAPSVLGEVAFLDGGPRSASLIAVSDGELASFDMAAFEALAGQDAELARRIALDLGRIAAVRLRLLSERLES